MPNTRLSSAATNSAVSSHPSKTMPSCTPEKLLCEVCGKGFTHSAVLGRHRSLHRKEQVSVKPLLTVAETFPCKACGKVFKSLRTVGCHRCSQACDKPRSLKQDAGLKDDLVVAEDLVSHRLDVKADQSIPVVSNNLETKSSSTVTENVRSISAKDSAALVETRSKTARGAKVDVSGSDISSVCTSKFKALMNVAVKSPRMKIKYNTRTPSKKPEPRSKEPDANIPNADISPPGVKIKSEPTEKKKGRQPVVPHTCKICNKDFNSLRKLQKHATLHDPSKPYRCDICGKFFDDARFVKTHRTLHEKKSRKECNVCGKVFNERIFFDIHCLTHIEQKPFRCDVCEDIFKDKTTFIRHCKGHKARTRKVAERFLSMKEVLKQKLEVSNRQS